MTPDLKFIWKRVKQRKLLYTVIVLVLALVWIPTGIDDFITIPFLITLFGYKVYLTIALILVGVLIFFTINGRINEAKELMKKPSREEAKKVCTALYKKEEDIRACIKKNVMKNFEK